MTNRERTVVRDAIDMAKRSAILRERAMLVPRETVTATDVDIARRAQPGSPSVAVTVSVPRHCGMCGGAVCLCGLDDWVGTD